MVDAPEAPAVYLNDAVSASCCTRIDAEDSHEVRLGVGPDVPAALLHRRDITIKPPPPPEDIGGGPGGPGTAYGPRDPAAGICTIKGTARKNRLVGTPGNDIICGFGGNDVLIGRGGNDILVGGFGNDTVKGGRGETPSTGTTVSIASSPSTERATS
jgi:hemolysin type calcium-binding protein